MTTQSAVLPFSSTVSFFDYGINSPLPGPNEMSITQQEYAQDAVVMRFWGSDINSSAIASGSPIVVSWGRYNSQRTFYGYVNHPTRTSNALLGAGDKIDRNSVTITCVGASWPMRQTGTKTWTNYTTAQVIVEIAALFHLSADVVQDTTTWPTLSMSGKTYFQFCCDLAKRIGYTFYCNGTQLFYKPRQTNPATLKAVSAIYDFNADPNSLAGFNPTLGAASPSGGQLRNRQVAGINPRTNQVIYSAVAGSPSPVVLGTAPDAPVLTTTEHFTINSQQEADAKTSGAGALNQMYITATAHAGGNALISQGSMIFVKHANGSQNGLWFVQKAVHKLSKTTYTLDLTLGRDSLGETATFSILPQTANAPSAKLVNSVWVEV
jgi:phage protein D